MQRSRRAIGAESTALLGVAALAIGAISPCLALPGAADLIAAHPEKSGLHVLDRGEEALLARAWLVDHAERSVDVQYFIWSTDNVGILAAEALLRAADRGVHVRVIVDDFLVDAPSESLLALAAHPQIEIRIYNPQSSVGVSFFSWLRNVVTDFRGVNQRMHDKTLIVDGEVAITGGRNVADEYYDYNQRYNFRDRDMLLFGQAVDAMTANFVEFWGSALTVPVERLLEGDAAALAPDAEQRVYADLHAYASDTSHFAPEVRAALANLSERFPPLLDSLVWDDAVFVSDVPGKNTGRAGLGGGGESTAQLRNALAAARSEILIQSPYLVLPQGGLELFRELVARGVTIRIVTNSLASTDNLQAFSGYSKQRQGLLDLGVELREFKPAPAVEAQLIERYAALEKAAPIFAIHAKSFVVDGRVLFVGTFNLDPRSANLNTEVGVLVDNDSLAQQVRAQILTDMRAENSWDPSTFDADGEAGLSHRLKLFCWKLLPLTPVL
jgi:putative cardiolipin synthase